MKSVQLPGGLRMAYRESGRGSRTILLIHGNTASSIWWERVMGALGDDWRALAPDLRGCGDSDKPATQWTWAELADDLYQFTRALGVERVSVVGHSLGGGLAQQLTVDHPDLVERLVLIDAAPPNGLHFPPAFYAQMEQLVQQTGLFTGALAATMPTAPKDEFYAQVLEESVTKSSAAWIPNTHALEEMQLAEQLGALTVPTLILYGQMDRVVTLSQAQEIRDAIPGAQLEVWEGIGHSAPMEAPGRLAARLAEFLA